MILRQGLFLRMSPPQTKNFEPAHPAAETQ